MSDRTHHTGYTPLSEKYNSEDVLRDFWECPLCKTRWPVTGVSSADVKQMQGNHIRFGHKTVPLR